MRFDQEKKKMIVLYLLEKIEQNSDSITKTVAEACGVNQNTVHTYIKELLEENLIKRVKRGKYELVSFQKKYHFTRSAGHLNSDTYAFEICLKDRISNFGTNVQDIWSYAFSEMVNNVMDHSEAENLYVVVSQNCLKTQVFIADDGIGIFQKIKDHFNLPSLDEAICELFKGKLTTDTANHSGEGIFFSSKLMDLFLILSSNKIFTINKFENENVFDVPSLGNTGTCVIMELSNFSHKTSREVFDRYSNTDGDFTKTTIPLKNIFDSSPVSRSQAKRVCNRLDKFKEVDLDFDGLEWMGQGFAHQLFVVFQTNHPGIKLVPRNMNDAIAKMYRHVCSNEN